MDPNNTLQIWQAIVAGSIAFAAVFVSSIVGYWAYRNNFGWKPGILLIEKGLGSQLAYAGHRFINYEVEIWNRRRYPISAAHFVMKLTKIGIDRELPLELVQPLTIISLTTLTSFISR
jgi:hypothetical protein